MLSGFSIDGMRSLTSVTDDTWFLVVVLVTWEDDTGMAYDGFDSCMLRLNGVPVNVVGTRVGVPVVALGPPPLERFIFRERCWLVDPEAWPLDELLPLLVRTNVSGSSRLWRIRGDSSAAS